MFFHLAKFIRFGLVSLFVLLLGVTVFGQFGSGLQGTITDQSGGLIPGATVTLTNTATNQSIDTTTNDAGLYRFNGLAQGTYNVLVTQNGFKKKLVEKVVVNAETIAGLDIKLETGEISAQVTVDGSNSTTLETESANVGKNITTKEVLQLPQFGRDPYQLARLAPGVFGDGSRAAGGTAARLGNNGTGPGGSNNGIFAVENQTQISANGQRVTSNNYEIDGVSVNSQTWGGAAVITPTQESVSEVQVTSSTYSAEDGRNSGAQVKVVSKYGTNDWHGSAFLKLNNPGLNAYNKYFGVTGVAGLSGISPTRVNDKTKTYGGSFGGKLIKDKLFFFAAYEGTKNSTNTVTGTTFVETAAFRQSLLALRPGTVSAKFFSKGFEPRVAEIVSSADCSNLIAAYNTPTRCRVVTGGLDIGSIGGTYGTYFNDADSYIGGGLDGIADIQAVRINNFSRFAGNQYSLRLDYQATEKDKFTFTSNFTPLSSFTTNSGAQARPQSDLNSDRLTYLVGGIYSRAISSTILNEFRFNYTSWNFNELEANPDTDWGLPRVEVEATFSDRFRFGAPRAETTPGFFDQKTMDFRDTLTSVWGNQTLKFGAEFRKEINTSGSPGGARPLFSFTRIWNFANGAPVIENINADATGKPIANDVPFNTTNLAFYVQNNWKVRPNLTLNLGLRWEYFAPITIDGGKKLGNLQLGQGNNALIDAKIVTNETLTDKDWNNFAPQLGFSWSPKWFDGKAVIRGGGGLGYDRLASALFSNARFNPPNASRFGPCCASNTNPFFGGQILYAASTDGTIYGYPQNPNLGGGGYGANGGPLTGSVEIYGSPRDLPTAHVYRFSLEGQYELPLEMVATLGYQGSMGRHFVRIMPLHLIYPRLAASTYRAVYFASPDVNTSYNAMIVSLKKRFSKSFDLNANYKWSKSLDTVSVEAPCACTNQTYPFDNSTERGPSDFDVPHHFVLSGTWEPSWFKGQNNMGNDLLYGWSLSPIVTWRAGYPWTPVISNGVTLSTDTATVNPTRPRVYYGKGPLDNTNENFLKAGGIFPGNLILNAAGTAAVACNTPLTVPTGCSNYFLTTANGTSFATNVPGIGRNSFRGPKYFSVDFSIAKSVDLARLGVLGEQAKIDLRFNFFNLLNNLNLSTFTYNSASTQINNAQFGTATSGLAGRVGEFQVRFSF